MSQNTALFDALINRLSSQLAAADGGGTPAAETPPAPRAPDAIDDILASPPRATNVRSLRDDPVIVSFRRELMNGMIRADTAHKLLGLLSTLLDRVLATRP